MRKPLSVTTMPKPPTQSIAPKAEIRKHYFLDEYVSIAPHAHTNQALAVKHRPASLPLTPGCILDDASTTSLWHTPRSAAGNVRVIEHPQPGFSFENEKAFGKHEVVVESPEHGARFSNFSTDHITDVLAAYRHRLDELKRTNGVAYVLLTKDSADAGHAHAQIHALPFIPPTIAREGQALTNYKNAAETCAYCDALLWEESQKVRIISTDKNIITFAPYATMSPLETWIMPRRHVDSLSALNTTELSSLAIIMKKLAVKLDVNGLDYSILFQESARDQDHHFVIKIQPRIGAYSAAERSAGLYINSVSPEYAALWYQGRTAYIS